MDGIVAKVDLILFGRNVSLRLQTSMSGSDRRISKSGQHSKTMTRTMYTRLAQYLWSDQFLQLSGFCLAAPGPE